MNANVIIPFEQDRAAQVLLGLLTLSLGNEASTPDLCALTVKEWNRLVDLSFDESVAALSVDGYNLISGECSECLLETDEELDDPKLSWFGNILMLERDFRYKFIITERLAAELSQKGVECKVLKGFSFATYYMHPDHRDFEDCDIYLGRSGWEIGNKVAVKLGGSYDFGTYKHSHLFLERLMIENHRYLTDFAGTRQGKLIEKLLEAAIEESPGRAISGSHLICPNDHFNALFLIKHAHGNFMYGGLTLRMIYDWAALLGHCQESLDWERINAEFDICKLRSFADIMTSLCVDYLGVKLSCPGIALCRDKALVQEIMEDTLTGGIYTKGQETFVLKCIRIARRFARIWHYRALATESVPRMIWNNFVFSSYFKRKIEM